MCIIPQGDGFKVPDLTKPNLYTALETLGLSQCHSKDRWEDLELLTPVPLLCSLGRILAQLFSKSKGAGMLAACLLRHTERDLFLFLRKKFVSPSGGLAVLFHRELEARS